VTTEVSGTGTVPRDRNGNNTVQWERAETDYVRRERKGTGTLSSERTGTDTLSRENSSTGKVQRTALVILECTFNAVVNLPFPEIATSTIACQRKHR